MPDPGGVTTTGTGRVAVQPDVVVARLAAQVTGPQAAAAHHAAARASRSVVEALLARGVARTDVRTVQTSAWTAQGDVVTEGRRSVTRLPRTTVTVVVEARLRDLVGAGQLVDDALAAGGEPARLESTAWQVSDAGAARVEARARAFADAVAAARQLAELAGRRLGPVLEVSEAGPGGPAPVRAMSAARAASVPLEGGEQDVVVELVVRHGWADGYDDPPGSR
jgi:uncharacterized protein YggE